MSRRAYILFLIYLLCSTSYGSCPANSSLDDGICKCDPGFTKDTDGVCKSTNSGTDPSSGTSTGTDPSSGTSTGTDPNTGSGTDSNAGTGSNSDPDTETESEAETKVEAAAKAGKAINKVNTVSNEIISGVSALLFQGVHSIRSQGVSSAMEYFVFMNIDFPSSYSSSSQWASDDSNSGQSSSQARRVLAAKTATDIDKISNIDRYLEDQKIIKNLKFTLIYILTIIMSIAIIEGFLFICKKKRESRGQFYHKTIERAYLGLAKGSKSLRWSFLINIVISKYQGIAFFSFLGIYNAARKNEDIDGGNLTLAIIGTIFTVCWLLWLFFIIKSIFQELKAYNKEKEMKQEEKVEIGANEDQNKRKPQKIKRFKTTKELEEKELNEYLQRRLVLYKQLRRWSFLQLLYPLFLMVRLFGFSIIIVFFNKATELQLGYLNITTLLMIIYLIAFMPLHRKGELWVTLAYEVDFFIAVIGTTILYIYNQSGGTNTDTRNTLGFIIMGAGNAVLVLNIGSIIVLNWKKIIFLVKKVKGNSSGSLAKPSQIIPEKISQVPVEGDSHSSKAGFLMVPKAIGSEEHDVLSIDSPSYRQGTGQLVFLEP